MLVSRVICNTVPLKTQHVGLGLKWAINIEEILMDSAGAATGRLRVWEVRRGCGSVLDVTFAESFVEPTLACFHGVYFHIFGGSNFTIILAMYSGVVKAYSV